MTVSSGSLSKFTKLLVFLVEQIIGEHVTCVNPKKKMLPINEL